MQSKDLSYYLKKADKTYQMLIDMESVLESVLETLKEFREELENEPELFVED